MSINKRPEITEELIDFIRQTISGNPDKGRSWISVRPLQARFDVKWQKITQKKLRKVQGQ
jgi:hypothetical protein